MEHNESHLFFFSFLMLKGIFFNAPYILLHFKGSSTCTSHKAFLERSVLLPKNSLCRVPWRLEATALVIKSHGNI